MQLSSSYGVEYIILEGILDFGEYIGLQSNTHLYRCVCNACVPVCVIGENTLKHINV